MKIYNDEKLTAKIVCELAFCSERTANRRINELKKAMHIQHHELLVVEDFVRYYKIKPERVVWRTQQVHNEIDISLPCLDYIG
jgi:hypothetical protein